MGVRLLHRTTRRVGLTEHGARFLARVGEGLAQIEAAFVDLDSVRAVPAGKLRINLPRVAAERLVMPHLPTFLARYPQVEVELFVEPALADLVQHACIVHRLSSGRLMAWEFSRDGRDFEVAVSGRLVFNDAGLVHAAARAGLGMGQAFEATVAADIASGRLRSVLQDWQQPFAGFHLYYPAREQMAPKLRVFIDHLRQAGHAP